MITYEVIMITYLGKPTGRVPSRAEINDQLKFALPFTTLVYRKHFPSENGLGKPDSQCKMPFSDFIFPSGNDPQRAKAALPLRSKRPRNFAGREANEE